MELNFDKEIDAILRKGSGGVNHGGASDSSFATAHLDADEISTFAENALPESAKIRCTAHLADCQRCRKILSNLILLNAEPASEFVHAPASAAAIPWYRKFFVFPNFAYTLGVLVLFFGAMIVFTILPGIGIFENADVSRVSNKAASVPAPANANVSSSNMTAPANMAANTNTSSAANNTAAGTRLGEGFGEGLTATPAPANSAVPTDEVARDKDLAQPPVSVDDKNMKEQPAVREDDERAKAISNYRIEPKPKTEQQKQERPSAAPLGDAVGGKLSAKKKANEKTDSEVATATKNVGGKTFRRANNVWYDTAYSNQPTTNVSRGSAEYKNLDGGLRSIAEKLGGVVIVVWKSKAYRIQ